MLPLSFHKSFIPERHFIAAILHYAALGRSGTYQEISLETGIPMGESTGKVPAILDYARGMGLIEPTAGGSAMKTPTLTPKGRAMYLEDRYLAEPMSQWAVHMSLCRGDTGAPSWNAAFARSRLALGPSFTRPQLESHLSETLGPGKNLIGPLLSTYGEDAGLSRSRVVTEHGGTIQRGKAPLLESHVPSYSAHMLTLIEQLFPRQRQVSIEDCDKETMWFDICCWSISEVRWFLDTGETKGFFAVDRHSHPWIIEPRMASSIIWERAYEDLS